MPGLEGWFVTNQYDFLPIAPPDPGTILRQPARKLLAFHWKNFPDEFMMGLLPEMRNGVPVYPITIAEDPLTRDMVFFNSKGVAVYALSPAKDYDHTAYFECLWPSLVAAGVFPGAEEYFRRLYDPARIQIDAVLIPAELVATRSRDRRAFSESPGVLSVRGGHRPDAGDDFYEDRREIRRRQRPFREADRPAFRGHVPRRGLRIGDDPAFQREPHRRRHRT